MESELTACLFECYFDDADYEFKDINDMSLKQLVIYKKQLLDLQGGNKLTKKQKEIFNGKFKEDVWNEYPSTLYNATELEAEFDKKMRLLEFKKYKEVCYKINNNLFNDSKDMILKIEELEIQLKEQSETKYKANHKVFMMERITCKCGMESIRSNLSHHKKSKFHLIYESNVAKVQAEKLTKIQAKQKQNQINSRMNNGYQLNDEGKIVWPLDTDGNRVYLLDQNGKNIYPKNKDGDDIWMKDKNGITIRPEQEKVVMDWLFK
jgi:hypothetical protein